MQRSVGGVRAGRRRRRRSLRLRLPRLLWAGIRALASYLAVHQHLPADRMAQLFADVLHVPASVGALSTMVTEAAAAVDPFLDATRSLFDEAPAANFDETGGGVEGSLQWVHSASTEHLTLLGCHKKRGRVAMDDLGVIGEMAGVAVHDSWKPYRRYDVDHASCNAHHLRELLTAGIRPPPSQPPAQTALPERVP